MNKGKNICFERQTSWYYTIVIDEKWSFLYAYIIAESSTTTATLADTEHTASDERESLQQCD